MFGIALSEEDRKRILEELQKSNVLKLSSEMLGSLSLVLGLLSNRFNSVHVKIGRSLEVDLRSTEKSFDELYERACKLMEYKEDILTAEQLEEEEEGDDEYV